MDHLLAARAQMGTSLAFHFIFSALGIGMPLMLVIAEGLCLRGKDADYARIARTWAKALAGLFAIGAVSGTALSFELGLLWPEFMRHAGAVIGMPFSAEGFAFFIEAIFIGIYLYGRERLSPLAHWLSAIPIAVSGIASAVFVVSVNAWMNTPAGFRLEHGQAVDINPLAAMLNPAFPTEAIHTVLAAFVFVGFAIASIYANTILRKGSTPYLQRALYLGMLVGSISIPLQIVMGDVSARFDASAEPMKFASLEGQFETQAGAPLRIGGYPDDAAGKTIGAIEIPKMLSFLAFENPDAVVRGLRSFPQNDVPNSLPVHINFQLMVGSGSALLLIGILWSWLTRIGRREPRKPLLRLLTIAGPLAFIAMESGWMVTEEGRQPWIVSGVWRTSDAVTTAPALDLAFYGFSILYMILAATLVWLLLRIGDDNERKSRTAQKAQVS
jgi:cytochrome d ubiquinol oxidase subunit I